MAESIELFNFSDFYIPSSCFLRMHITVLYTLDLEKSVLYFS